MNSEYLFKLKKISKYFAGPAGTKSIVLDDINLEIKKEPIIISLLASFGSGKSTLLKIISGVEKPSGGERLISSQTQKLIPYIPEKPSSFPWLNVKENIEFSLNLKNNLQEKSDIISEIISLVGLTGYENHIPNNKSIGFRFRISFARALALQPEIILIDDCFKGTDRLTKEESFEVIEAASTKYNIPILFATTNVSDAVLLSEKIILMKKNPGKILEEIENKSSNKENEQLLSENFTSIKTRIEKAFRKENQLNSLDISI